MTTGATLTPPSPPTSPPLQTQSAPSSQTEGRWSIRAEQATTVIGLIGALTTLLVDSPKLRTAFIALMLVGLAWLFRVALRKCSRAQRARLSAAVALLTAVTVGFLVVDATRDWVIHDFLGFARPEVTIVQVTGGSVSLGVKSAASELADTYPASQSPSPSTSTKSSVPDPTTRSTASAPQPATSPSQAPSPTPPAHRQAPATSAPSSTPAPPKETEDAVQNGVLATFSNEGDRVRIITRILLAYRVSGGPCPADSARVTNAAPTVVIVDVPADVSVTDKAAARGGATRIDGKNGQSARRPATVKVTWGQCGSAQVELSLTTVLNLPKKSVQEVLITTNDSRIPVAGIDDASLDMTIELEDGSKIVGKTSES
jgi:hypothetical protein